MSLMEEPAATPCGHNYCRKCLKVFWDGEQEYRIYSCPQCMKTFAARPLPTDNTVLAVTLEQLKNTGAPGDEADHCYTGPGDVTEAGPGDMTC